MAHQHTVWAWRQNVTSSEKLVLLCLASYANKQSHEAFPQTNTVVKRTGLSRATVYRCMRDLEDKGLLVEHGRRYVVPIWREYEVSLRDLEVSPCDSDVSPCDKKSHHETSIYGNDMGEDDMGKEKLGSGSLKDQLEKETARKKSERQRKITGGKLATKLAHIFKGQLEELYQMEHVVFSKAEYGMFDHFINKVGDERAEELLREALERWDEFRLHLQKTMGAQYDATVPQMNIILKQANYLVSFVDMPMVEPKQSVKPLDLPDDDGELVINIVDD